MENKFDSLIDTIKKINGVGKKASSKIIFDLISNPEHLNSLKDMCKDIESSFSECENCFYIKIDNFCEACDGSTRNTKQICVVSQPQDVKTIIDSEFYNGVFHVIKGEININKNASPEKLKINELFDKISKGDEIILALNSTFEGEVTANYIASNIKEKDVKITRLARGIPIGGVLDYIDKETLKNALDNRKKI